MPLSLIYFYHQLQFFFLLFTFQYSTNLKVLFMWNLTSYWWILYLEQLMKLQVHHQVLKSLQPKKWYIRFSNLYVLVQCTPDLSTSDCNQCLLLANLSLSICCNNNRGVRVLFPSCNFRFDNYSFFNEVAFDAMVARPPSTPVALPPPSPGSRAVGEGSIFFFIIS